MVLQVNMFSKPIIYLRGLHKMNTVTIKRPAFLVLPAYIIAIIAAFASHYLLPAVPGMVVSAVLVLAMLTFFSLVHPKIGGELTVQICAYAAACTVAYFCAEGIFASDFGPMAIEELPLTWAQIGFLTLQQALYFGVHAFSREG